MADGMKFKKTSDQYAISGFQAFGITYVVLFAILLMLAFIFGAIFVNMSYCVNPPTHPAEGGREMFYPYITYVSQ